MGDLPGQWWWTVIGVVLVLEGAPYFLSPKGVKALMAQLHQIGNPALRWIGFVMLLLGLGCIYLGTR